MNILGIRIDNLSKKETLEKVNRFLNEGEFHQIATVNPEFILAAQTDAEFRDILNQCDLSVVDGVGIWFAFLRYGKYLKARMTGIDLMKEILKIANEKKLGVFLLASDRGLSTYENVCAAILKKYPRLQISGADINPVIARSGVTKQSPNNEPGEIKNEIATLLTVARNDIVFCNFGAPEQEKFLYSLKNQENAKIKLVMGVGGSFDYLTGKISRAPFLLRKAGLEWLWRLIQQPQRIKRIWNAVIIFPLKIIFSQNNE